MWHSGRILPWGVGSKPVGPRAYRAGPLNAGSVEAFLLFANGQQGVWSIFGNFTVPVLLGNVVGGTALFALISYAQIMKEL